MLTFDQGTREVCREGFGDPVQFKGKKNAWEILLILHGNGRNYSSREGLDYAWTKQGNDKPTASQLDKELSTIRELIKCIFIDIENIPSLGWRLAELREEKSKTEFRQKGKRK